jgi:rRNA maturation endonuclease Nob1
MTKKQHHECELCEAVFRIGFDMDPKFYEIKFCPFCGEELDKDERDDAWDIEDVDNE